MEKQYGNCDWWRMNKFEAATYHIEWTPHGGIVRARTDDRDWEYCPCSDVRFALDVGFKIIENQKSC